nr:piggyBac transposable element-derived protein 4-like [Hydra vulgaris]
MEYRCDNKNDDTDKGDSDSLFSSSSSSSRKSSRYKDQKPINAKDMQQYLGIILHMGCVKLPSIDHYWAKNSLYRLPLFSRIMSQNKFQLILHFWHFVKNEDLCSGHLHKVKVILDHLINRMDEKIPDKNISIDESMMLWRGRLIFRQNNKKKKHKYGVKLYELWESDSVVIKVKIYSGEATLNEHLLGQMGAIVLDLIENFLGKSYHLKTYICGTLRGDCKSNPKDCTAVKLKMGGIVSRSREVEIVAKWQNIRGVLMISNIHLLAMHLNEETLIPPVNNNKLDYLAAIPQSEVKKMPAKPCRVCSK